MGAGPGAAQSAPSLVVLVRHAVFGWEGWTDFVRFGALVVFGLVMWRVAIRAMTQKLVD